MIRCDLCDARMLTPFPELRVKSGKKIGSFQFDLVVVANTRSVAGHVCRKCMRRILREAMTKITFLNPTGKKPTGKKRKRRSKVKPL